MKKITSLVLSLALAFGIFAGCGKVKEKEDNKENAQQTVKFDDAKLEEGVVALVGDIKITLDEFKFYLSQYGESIMSQSGLSFESAKEEKEAFWTQTDPSLGEVLKDLAYNLSIDSYVGLVTMTNLAKEKGISVSEDELKENLNQEGIEDAIKYYTENYGISRETIESYLKSNLIYEKYANEYIEKDERMQPSDKRIKELFKKDYLKAQHILIMTVNQETQAPYSEEEKAAALENAKSILEEVKKKGADFKAIMLEKSEDPGSQQQPDGYVFTEGDMVTEFYEGTKSIRENEISDIVETSYGYHIIKRLPLEDADMEEAKPSIENKVKTEAFQEILKEAKDKMKIKVDYEQLGAITGILY